MPLMATTSIFPPSELIFSPASISPGVQSLHVLIHLQFLIPSCQCPMDCGPLSLLLQRTKMPLVARKLLILIDNGPSQLLVAISICLLLEGLFSSWSFSFSKDVSISTITTSINLLVSSSSLSFISHLYRLLKWLELSTDLLIVPLCVFKSKPVLSKTFSRVIWAQLGP